MTTVASVRAAPSPTSALPDVAVLSALADAMAAAEAFEGATAPNPPVGCVILDSEGRELARAAHQKAGEAHAEAGALAKVRAAGLEARIHAFVVTLEPCNHHGRTAPCAEAILSTPAREVWIGAMDPNPQVAGGGAARLRAAGLKVGLVGDLGGDGPALAARCRRLIAPFLTLAREGRPFITLKRALDPAGSMIPPPGRKTFTSEASLTLAHRLRRRADAIVTGSGTILADDPAFTVRRVPDHPGKRRILAILDRRRRTPEPYLDAARTRGFEPILADDLDALIADLGARGVMEALVEAGPTLSEAIMSRDLWDEQVTIRQARGARDEVQVQLRWEI